MRRGSPRRPATQSAAAAVAAHRSPAGTTPPALTHEVDSYPVEALDEDEAQAALDELLRRYEQHWPERPLPGLGGRSPREAAAEGGAPLAELRAILDDIEWGAHMDADRLRSELGLSG